MNANNKFGHSVAVRIQQQQINSNLFQNALDKSMQMQSEFGLLVLQ